METPEIVKTILKELHSNLLKEFSKKEIGFLYFKPYRILILQLCDKHNYLSNWNNDTRINKIVEHYNYWDKIKVGSVI